MLAVVAIAMVVLVALVEAASRCRRVCTHRARVSRHYSLIDKAVPLLRTYLHGVDDGDDDGADVVSGDSEGRGPVPLPVRSPLPVPSVSPSPPSLAHAGGVCPGDASAAPMRARAIGAAVNLLLSGYATLSLAVVKLLHCVAVPGTDPTSTWLFINGDVACSYSGWQLPLVVVLALLVATPLCLPLLSAWASRDVPTVNGPAAIAVQRGRGIDTSPVVHSRRQCCCVCGGVASKAWLSPALVADVRWGVHRALCGSYHVAWHWWEAALMVQRLLLALVFTFASAHAPGVAVLANSVVCVLALVAHVSVRPLHAVVSHRLQTVLLLCLTVVSFASGPYAVAQESATVAVPVPSNQAARVLTVLFGVVVPVVALAAAYAVPLLARKWSRAGSA